MAVVYGIIDLVMVVIPEESKSYKSKVVSVDLMS